MTRNKKRKFSGQSSSCDFNSIDWKKVDVGLLESSGRANNKGRKTKGNTSGDDDFEGNNHYDNPSSKIYRSANKDLEAEPQEGFGMFFGLEVVSGDALKVLTDRLEAKHSPLPESTVDETIQEESLNSSDRDKKVASKKKKKKKKKKANEDPNEIDINKSLGDNKNPTTNLEESSASAETDQKEQNIDSSTAASSREPTSLLPPAKSMSKDAATAASETDETHDSALLSLQSSWMTASGGVELDHKICKALLENQFWTPTPIQAATLAAAILGRRNIVGAAPTGSGKTIAYLLPIFQKLFEDSREDDDEDEKFVKALILSPTRELALQIQGECEKIKKRSCVALVGGLAHEKQKRILEKIKPPMVIATPGRLWEMMSSKEYAHLNDLSQVSFLVIDEADRMIEQGSFPQLGKILDSVERDNPMDESEDEGLGNDDEDHDNLDEDQRLLGLPGIRGEARVAMLSDDILNQIERMKEHDSGKEPQPVNMEDEELEDDNKEEVVDNSDEDVEVEIDAMDDISENGTPAFELPVRKPVVRQTFVFSATLTLPPSVSGGRSSQKHSKRRKVIGVDGAIEEILDKARSVGKTKVVDLSNSKKQALFNEKITKSQRGKEMAVSESAFQLPPGLSLYQIKCTQKHKDSHLYSYLMTTRQGSSGPCLIFCNSIPAVKRVGATLQTLGLPAKVLHANMQQRARFKAVESLRDPTSRAMVVATDVAARGLDISSVSTVIHYDVARKVDTFVHRAGRTARGMGEGAVGCSVSLISPAEDKTHARIGVALNVKFKETHMDGRLLSAAQERANLASKIVASDTTESRTQRNNQWFVDQAKDAGIEIDDDLLDEGLAGGDNRDRQQLHEAKVAKVQLRRLLAEPMVTQRYGKFLSRTTATSHVRIAPLNVTENTKGKKRRRRSKR